MIKRLSLIRATISLAMLISIISAEAGLPAQCQQMGGVKECINAVRYETPFRGTNAGVSPPVQFSEITAEQAAAEVVRIYNQYYDPTYNNFSFTLVDIPPHTCATLYTLPSSFYINKFAVMDAGCGTQFYYRGAPGVVTSTQKTAIIGCPTGYTIKSTADIYNQYFKTGDYPPVTCMKNGKIASKQPQNSCSTTHPISIGTGIKTKVESEYTLGGFGIYRQYTNDGVVGNANIGGNWKFNFDQNLAIETPTWVTIFLGDGRYLHFKLIGNVWTPDADIADRLNEVIDASNVRVGWNYYNANTDATENYDIKGNLTSIVSKAGRVTTYTSNSSGNITTITSDIGQQVKVVYRADIPTVDYLQLPDGSRITYGYSITDGNYIIATNLSSVTYPDNKTKTYLYGETANVSATPYAGVSYVNSLTGIIDENGNRYASYFYDAAGRAYDEEIAPNLGTSLGQRIEHNNLVYNVDASGNPTSTTVTDSLGSVRTYNFTTILGVVKSTGQTQPGGSGCSASAAALTYDANGNVASRTDFKGNKTTYIYDMARNLETSRTEGLTSTGSSTAATRTITTTWHPTWRLPLVTSEYNGATATGTALRTTTNVYDAKGNLTSITEADPMHSLSRTTTITYIYSTALPGLVLTKVIDGPRTDVNDVTTYNYYPHDATCTPSAATPIIDPITGTSPANLGCRGQLMSITNALNQTTTYDRYNHHGQVEQMTDANGLVTSYSYDLRQRLLSKTVSGSNVATQTTNLTYDGVGQVTQLTLPDNSSLNYSYDAAHRLTDVQDSLGNKVHYTLDAAGNRINETTTDPLGTLTKTLNRSYDALNRLQQVTGVE